MKNSIGCTIKTAVIFFAVGCAVGAGVSGLKGCKRKVKRVVRKKLQGFVDAADRYMDEI